MACVPHVEISIEAPIAAAGVPQIVGLINKVMEKKQTTAVLLTHKNITSESYVMQHSISRKMVMEKETQVLAKHVH